MENPPEAEGADSDEPRLAGTVNASSTAPSAWEEQLQVITDSTTVNSVPSSSNLATAAAVLVSLLGVPSRGPAQSIEPSASHEAVAAPESASLLGVFSTSPAQSSEPSASHEAVAASESASLLGFCSRSPAQSTEPSASHEAVAAPESASLLGNSSKGTVASRAPTATAETATEAAENSSQSSCTSESSVGGIDSLNPEIMRLIFAYLEVQDRGRAAQVCSAWRAIADERCIWNNVEARLRLTDRDTTALECVARRCIRRVKVLSFKDGLSKLLELLPDMETLDLSDCNTLNDIAVNEAFGEHQCATMASLNMSWCSELTDAAIDCVTRQFPSLEKLYLIGCERISDLGMGLIAARLARLKLLEIRECDISNAGLKYLAGISDDGQPSDTAGVRELTYLGLEYCEFVSDAGLEYVSLGMRSLEILDLSLCDISDAALQSVSKIATLKKLVLACIDDLTGQSIHHLATGRFSLSTLDISFCNNIDDEAISNVCRGRGLLGLTKLKMNGCPITDFGLSIVALNLVDLTVLNISDCKLVSKDGIAVVAAHLQRLRAIHMEYCSGVTNGALKQLLRMPSLEVANLKGCRRITGRGMALIPAGETPSNILEMDISFTNIGDTGLRHIAQGMQKLRGLSVSGCKISDKGLGRIARHLSCLRTLELSRCTGITDRGIKLVACNLKNLRFIDINDCAGITAAGRRCLVTRLPHLKFL
ncbi:uncharacterized protein LOC144179739 [Haemaphysalis longicornis]